MPSLVDIAKIVETYDVRGTQVEVPGISAQGLALLFHRFEELRKFFGGHSDDVNAAMLFQQVPEIIGAFIAAGTGEAGSAEAEKVASSLPIGDQLGLGELIWKVTFPRGYKDFLAALERLVGQIPVASGWEQDTTLAGRSNGSLNSGTHPPKPGDTHQDKSPDGLNSMTETVTESKQSS